MTHTKKQTEIEINKKQNKHKAEKQHKYKRKEKRDQQLRLVKRRHQLSLSSATWCNYYTHNNAVQILLLLLFLR